MAYQVAVGGHVELGQGQPYFGPGALLPVGCVGVGPLHGLPGEEVPEVAVLGQERVDAAVLVRQDEGHARAAPEGQAHGAEVFSQAVAAGETLVHEVVLYIALGGVEGPGGGQVLGEHIVPGGLEVYGAHQGQQRLGGHLKAVRAVLQQVSGLLVGPVLEELIISLGAGLAPEALGEVVPRQNVKGLLLIVDGVIEPYGVGKVRLAAVEVQGAHEPQALGLVP